MNKNTHFSLTLVLFGSWLTGLLTIFLVQNKVSLAHEQIYQNDILESNHSPTEKSLNESVVGNSLLGGELDITSQFLQDIEPDHISLEIPKQKDKPKTVTKSDFYLPEKEVAPKPKITTKTVTKSNSESFSSKTLELIREFEGFRSKAYRDTDGTPVIGYGLSKVAGRKVRMGDRISTHQAEAALKAEVKAIQAKIKSLVKVKLNSQQLGALTSFTFNTGFYSLKKSTLLRKLNAGDHHGAANELLRWNKAHSRGKLVPMAGLTRRRRAERQLFLHELNP